VVETTVAVRYQIVVKNAAGARQGLLANADPLGFSFSRVVNGVGAFALVISGVHPVVAYFVEGGQVEFWREDAAHGIPLYQEAGFLIDDLVEYTQGNESLFQASGVGYNGILARRVVAAYAGSAQAEKTGAAETVIKEYVDEQIVSATDADRQIAGMTIQANAAGGDTIAVYGAWQSLLEVCQRIAKSGGGDFDIVGNGDGAWLFKWFTGQMGTDRSASVIFALNYGNMKEPSWAETKSTSLNAILVAGQGAEADRATVWRETGAPAGITRREAFVDARDVETTTGLNTSGDAKLEESKFAAAFNFQPVQTAAMQYGRDYFLGDLVTAKYLTHQQARKIVSVSVSVNRGAPEVISIGTIANA
jgi:hypothetical protein